MSGNRDFCQSGNPEIVRKCHAKLWEPMLYIYGFLEKSQFFFRKKTNPPKDFFQLSLKIYYFMTNDAYEKSEILESFAKHHDTYKKMSVHCFNFC